MTDPNQTFPRPIRPPHAVAARRRGVALIMAVVVMGVLLLISGLCIEAGNVMYKRTVMQDAADAAARAGASTVGKGRNAALNAAYAVVLENAYVHKLGGNGATVRLEYGMWSLEKRTFTPTYSDQSAADAVRVTVNIPIKPMFVGESTMPTSFTTSSAIARRPTLVLVVGDANNLGQNDSEMLRRMKGWGVPTQVLSDEKVQASLFSTEDVVMISSSTQSSVIAGKLAGAKCAVICCEIYNWNELGLGVTYGEEIKVNKPANSRGPKDDYMDVRSLPETVSFAGQRKMYTGDGRIAWCKPRNNVTKVATWAGDPNKTVAFYYEKGKTLDNGTVAPGFRAGLFMRTEEAYADKWTYSADTWNCFDAMFAKCLPYVNKKVYLVQ